MRPSSRAVALWTIASCILAVVFSLNGGLNGQATAQSANSKRKLSHNLQLTQPRLSGVSPATTDTWTGAGSNADWSNASNWNSGAITSGENILINLTTAATVDDASSTIGTLTLSNAGDSVGINNGVVLTVDGNISNSGAISLNSTGSFTELVLGGNVTLSGTGTLTLSNNSQNYIFGGTSLDQLTNQETIQGAGQIGHGQMALVNLGTINANASAGMTIDANDGFTNTGTVEASASGVSLILQSMSMNNAGGTITASNGGTVNVSSTVVTGGTVTLSGASKLQLNSSTIGGATITNSSTGTIEIESGTNALGGIINNSAGGLLEVDNGAILYLQNGTYSQLGTVQLNSAGSFTELVLGGNVTLSGGTITLSNNSQNYIFGQTATDTLTNQETIQGAGQIGHGQMQLINSGTINSDDSAGMTIAANNGITNTGTLEATNGSTLLISGSGIINNAGGILSANTGTINVTSSTVDGGAITLTGASTLQLNTATIHDGNTITNSATGTIEIASGVNDMGGTINNSTGGLFKIDNGAILDLEGGTYSKLGTVQLNSTGSFTELVLQGNVTLSGGTVTLSNNSQNYIFGQVPTDTLTNEETISGAGQIGHGSMQLINTGTINSNSSAGITVSANQGITNTGTLEATNGSTLALSSSGIINNAGGTISANTGIISLTSSTVDGGNVTLTGASTFQMNTATLHDGSTLTNSSAGTIEIATGVNVLGGTINNSAGGLFKIDNGAILDLEGGTYSQLGSVQLNSSGSFTELVLEDNVTLSGGTITLSNNSQNYIYGQVATDTLTNQETIQGAGQIGHGQMQLINSGTINSDDSAGMTISANEGVTNTGTLEATSGSTLALSGSGTVNNAGGTISANTGTINVTTSVVDGGNITLTGASALQMTSSTIHDGSTITNSATGTIEIASGVNVLGGTINNSAGGIFKIDNGAFLQLEGGTYSQLGTMQMNSSGSITELTIEGNVTLSGGTLTMSANAQNYILGGNTFDVLTNKQTIQGAGQIGDATMGLVNTGTINANASGNLVINVSNQNFNNTGGIVEATGATLTIEGPGATYFTNDNESTNTLTGGTYIANGANILWNHGSSTGITTLAASVTEESGGTLVNTFNSANTNMLAGLTSITSAGSLTIGGTAFTDAGSFSNAGSLTILGGESFAVGSLSQISGGSLTAGTYVLDANLNLSGAAQTITTNAATLTLAGGTIENTANSTNTLAALATNSGKLTIGGASNSVSTSAASFSNTGTLTINAGDSFTAAKLTQISGTTLSGGTFLLGGNLDLTTAGITIATNSSTLTLQGGTINSNGVNALALTSSTKSLTLANNTNYTTATTGNFTNTGTVTVNSGSTLTVGGTSHSYKQTAGTTTVDGTLSGGTTGTTSFTGGTLQGAGKITGNTSVGNATGTAVTLNVGDSGKAGLLAITGTYTQLATATMKVSIGGLTTGTYSELTVSGTASLGGTLSVGIVNGLVLTSANIGTQFTILSSTGKLSGTFTNTTVTSGTDVFSVSYVGNTVVLTLTSVTGAKGSTSPVPSMVGSTSTKSLATTSKTALPHNNLMHRVSGVASKTSRPILVSGNVPPRLRGSSEFSNLRAWSGLLPRTINPIRALPATSLAAVENTSRMALPVSDPRIGASNMIGARMPSAGSMGNANNRRVPLKALPTIIRPVIR